MKASGQRSEGVVHAKDSDISSPKASITGPEKGNCKRGSGHEIT